LNQKKNRPPYVTKEFLRRFIVSALREDKGDGDHTSLSCIPAKVKGRSILLAKESGVIAGVELAKQILLFSDPKASVQINIPDGGTVDPGKTVFTAHGNIRALLLSERLLLNVMQRMSGIATHTKAIVDACHGTSVRILDTRKTTPNFRAIEKWAVVIGGGTNHRMGLYDMILIKDNHIDFCGGIAEAIKSVKRYMKQKNKKLKVVIEARNAADVEEIMRCGGVNRILLDNMLPADVLKEVNRINKQFETEVSGGIHLGNVREYALTGVDLISVGALTHQIKSLDLSFKADPV